MPNHCENILGVLGKTEDVMKFINFITVKSDESGDEYKIFKSLKPTPEELINTTSPSKEKNWDLINKYGADNWYDWCNNNWGTKWGDYDIHTFGIQHCNVTSYSLLENGEVDYKNPITKSSGESYIHFDFQTAWGPGSDFLKEQLSKQFPELIFRLEYEEPGMCFAGEVRINKGNIIMDDSWEYRAKYDSIVDIDWDYYESDRFKIKNELEV